MVKAKLWIWVIAGFVAVASVMGISLFLTGEKEPMVATEDLADHPIYKNYAFTGFSRVIDFGEQPLWIPTAVIIEVMKRDNILKDELYGLGFGIRFHPFLKGYDVNYFLLRGDLETAIGGDMPALSAITKGNNTAISIIQEGPVSVISRDIKTPKELKGKKIGYALGSNAHFYLLNTLIENGIDLNDVEFIKMDIVEMADVLYRKKIDAFSVWEPTAAIALKKYPEFIVTASGTSYGFIYLSDDLINSQPEVAKQILASEIRALKWIRKSDDNLKRASQWCVASALELAKKSGQKMPLDVEMVSSLTKKDLPGLTKEYPAIPKEIIEESGMLKKEFDLLRTLGFVSGDLKWEKIKNSFNLGLIEEVIQDPEKYKLDAADFAIN